MHVRAGYGPVIGRLRVQLQFARRLGLSETAAALQVRLLAAELVLMHSHALARISRTTEDFACVRTK